LPSGQGLRATFNGLTLVNVYAASGSAKRGEREHFYNSELPRLLVRPTEHQLLAGDFNCVLHSTETTASPNVRRALQSLISEMNLQDTWETRHNPTTYTHYHPQEAARLYRIYINRNLHGAKKDINTRRRLHGSFGCIITYSHPMVSKHCRGGGSCEFQ
jgi:exonuclease III